MATKTIYTCRECGGSNAKWLGKCPHCGAWNTLDEGVAEPAAGGGKNHRFQALAKSQPVATLSEIDAADVARTPTGQEELDRVLDGGIVAGGVVLIGGDPGIGKSTLLGHSSFKRPRGRPVTGLRGSEVPGFGDRDVVQCCFGRPFSAHKRSLVTADVCPPPRGLLWVTARVSDRLLQGGEIGTVDVGSGSGSGQPIR